MGKKFLKISPWLLPLTEQSFKKVLKLTLQGALANNLCIRRSMDGKAHLLAQGRQEDRPAYAFQLAPLLQEGGNSHQVHRLPRP